MTPILLAFVLKAWNKIFQKIYDDQTIKYYFSPCWSLKASSPLNFASPYLSPSIRRRFVSRSFGRTASSSLNKFWIKEIYIRIEHLDCKYLLHILLKRDSTLMADLLFLDRWLRKLHRCWCKCKLQLCPSELRWRREPISPLLELNIYHFFFIEDILSAVKTARIH